MPFGLQDIGSLINTTIYCHPDNYDIVVAELRNAIHAHNEKRSRLFNGSSSSINFNSMHNSMHMFSDGIWIEKSGSIPKTYKTGRVIYQVGPNKGEAVEIHQIDLHTRFVQYGSNDLSFLLWAGYITEETQIVLYAFNDLYIKKWMNFQLHNTMSSLQDRRILIDSAQA